MEKWKILWGSFLIYPLLHSNYAPLLCSVLYLSFFFPHYLCLLPSLPPSLSMVIIRFSQACLYELKNQRNFWQRFTLNILGMCWCNWLCTNSIGKRKRKQDTGRKKKSGQGVSAQMVAYPFCHGFPLLFWKILFVITSCGQNLSIRCCGSTPCFMLVLVKLTLNPRALGGSSRCLVSEVCVCITAVASVCVWGHIKALLMESGIDCGCCQGKEDKF